MEKSIFAGLTPTNLRIAFQQAKESPEALGAVLVIVVAVIAALAFAGMMTAHHLGGFTARIQEDEERTREEEEAEEAQKAAQSAEEREEREGENE